MGSKSGSQPGPTTTTTQTQNATLPPHIVAAQQSAINNANMLTQPFLTPTQYGVMGLTPDQNLASNILNGAAYAQSIQPNVPAYDVFGMGNQWNTGAPASGPKATASLADAVSAKAAQLKPGDINQFMNPYIDAALNPALNRLRQQQAEVQSGIGADAAASGMFGGSREAVSRMLADRNYRDTLASTAGNMLNSGWNQAAGLSSQNVDRSQQAALANMQAQNAINTLNATLGTSVSQSNAQLGNQSALQQQDLAFKGAQNDASRFLQAIELQNKVDSQNIQNSLALAGGLNQLGTQQQLTGQASLDLPFKRLQDLISVGSFNGPSGGTTTSTGTSTQPSKPTDWASIALGGLGLASQIPTGGLSNLMTAFLPASVFSDREAKTDIKKLGADPETGVDMYAYRYKDDPKTYPKVVGPMAQDLEKVMPGITRLIGGHRVIG